MLGQEGQQAGRARLDVRRVRLDHPAIPLVAEGLVEVDGQVETRKRCKIVAEQVVNFNGMKVVVKEGISPEIL